MEVKVYKPTIYMIDWETAEKMAPREYLETLGKKMGEHTVVDLVNLQILNQYPELLQRLQEVAMSQYRYVHFYEDKSLKTKTDEPVLQILS